MTFSIVLLVVFLAGMIGIGIWGMRKTATLNDFFLGGRSVGPWVSAFAYGTTYFSAVLFVGFGGAIGWGDGLKGLWIAFGNAIFGTLLAWFVLGRRTRTMTQRLDAMTMPEFLQERFDSKYIKMFAATIIFVFLVPYSAGVFKGLGYLFEANFHITYDTALLIMIAITGIYLILGGYFAVTLTDFIQGIIMIFGAILMVIVLTNKASEIAGTQGGLTGGTTAATQAYQQWLSTIPAAKQPSMYYLGALVFMTSFGVWGMPQMVQKFYAIKDESVITKAAILTTLFSIIITFAAYYTGALSHVFFTSASIPMMADPTKGPNFDVVIPTLLTQYLPEVLMGVILLLILSASMSTLSSLVLVSASSVAIDLYKGHINPKMSKEASLFMMRFLSAVFVALSYFVAKSKNDLIVQLMALSWGAVAGAFAAPFFYGLYWKRATHSGIVAGMISGVAVSIFLYYRTGEALPLLKDFYAFCGPKMGPFSASIGIFLPFIVVPVVSMFTKPVSKETLDRAFGSSAANPAPQRVSV
ncbi:MAG: sodium transporter [Planctomycetes bacterium GWF2_50_10]|nr:MAG: sodium transporter [Planctomycetes bacterium GWF2_50_10]